MQKISCKSKTKGRVENQQGFTLIEVISVLIITGVMVSAIIKKFDVIQDNANITALQAGIQELKARESVAWFKLKLSDTGYTNDTDVYNAVNKNIGSEYNWDTGPGISGGRLQFKSQSVDLNRIPSTPNSPGSWI